MLATHGPVCAAVRPEVMHADDDGVAYFQTSGFALKLRCATEEAIRWMMCAPTHTYAVHIVFHSDQFCIDCIELWLLANIPTGRSRYQCEGPALPHIAAETAFNGRQVQRAREAVARSLGAHADEIMLNECCAVGINYVAMGLEWRKGDVVVLTEHEHPSNRIPWYSVAERWGVKLHVLGQQPGVDQTGEAMLKELKSVLKEQGDRVRLVSASHVSRRTGARLQVTEMCTLVKQTVPTAHTLIDGAQVMLAVPTALMTSEQSPCAGHLKATRFGEQALGAIKVDVASIGCDFYVTNGHKYCLAPTGTGALYVSREALSKNFLKTSFVRCT